MSELLLTPVSAPDTLEVSDLVVAYRTSPAEPELLAVDQVSLRIAPGEAYGLIGESGSGKSSLAYALVRHSGASRIDAAVLRFKGQGLLTLSGEELRSLRGRRIGMVYQDPMSALNPLMRVGRQIDEVFEHHERLSPSAARTRTLALLEQVRFGDAAATIAERYPHQLSGGQQQRVVIAMAIACRPELLILDEPTTGLDVTTEAAILDLLSDLRHTLGCALLFISHNLAVVGRLCDRAGVLYAGRLVEEGTVLQVLTQPLHPYTRGLIGAAPSLSHRQHTLASIPGRLPDLRVVDAGCRFRERCPHATDACAVPGTPWREDAPGHAQRCRFDTRDAAAIPLAHDAPRQPVRLVRPGFPTPQRLLSVRGLGMRYGASAGPLARWLGPAAPRVLEGVDLDVDRGRTTAVVGESGSGKSTLARCIAGLLRAELGVMTQDGQPLPATLAARSRAQRQAVQLVFQNPEAALNPSHTVFQSLARPLQLYGLARAGDLRSRCIALLESVNLDSSYLHRHPAQLSGGEKQRVAIARAFAAEPALVICDEPTSSLDISVQAAILNQLKTLQRDRGTALLFISHDLAVVRHIADQVVVLRQGRVIESGPADTVFEHPRDPYTRALIDAVPRLPGRPPTTPGSLRSVTS
jgi:peptide/nickel transport system ATP-binding protein